MKFLIKIFVSAAFIFLCNASFSQVQLEWTAVYDSQFGQYDDLSNSVVADAFGNCYVTGKATDQVGSICATIKYNSSGSMEWIIKDPAASRGTFVTVNSQGEIYVLGMYHPPGSANNFVIIKYSSSGVLLWSRVLPGPHSFTTVPHSMVLDASGNIYISGSTGTPSNFDYVTAKYNSSGVLQWTQTYGSNNNSADVAYSIAVNNTGDVFVTGYTSNGNNKDYATVKYSSSGDFQWAKLHNGTGSLDDIGLSVITDNSGNIYVTGNSCGYSTMDDYVTIKYNPSGVVEWLQTYNGPQGLIDIPVSIALDAAGNVIVSGKSMGTGGYFDFATTKYSSSGSMLWAQRYSGESSIPDVPSSMTIDEQGSIFIAGKSGESGTGAVTVKYNSSGAIQWMQSFGKGQNNSAVSIALDAAGNIYVTGTSIIGNANTNFITAKYSQTVGIQPISNEIPNQYSLSQNYPNPFNPSTKIKFSIPSSMNGRDRSVLIIYDALGREIETLVNEQLNPGTYEVNWNASHHPSGVYFYRLNSGDFSQTIKMIMIK